MDENQSQQVAANPKLRSQRDETLRKLFLAMAEDIRVVIIKLADRLHNVRTLGYLKEHKRRRIALKPLKSIRRWPIAWAFGRSSGSWRTVLFVG